MAGEESRSDGSRPNDRARCLLVAGTASHVGKSTVVAGLCRLLARRGVRVAPFKAQNMSNNARVVSGGEIGVSQYVQARAAGITPTTDVNPVLLKPHGDGESQVVIDGQAVAQMSARSYYEERWERARTAAAEAYERLAAEYDVVIAEGAGSIAEPNLTDRDLANVETARFADAAVLLLGDIERGGVFATLYGTLELMPDDVRERVVGVAITKFRGNRAILDPAIADLEDRTGVPVLGVLPYAQIDLPEEDSVSLPPVGEHSVVGGGDGVPDARAVTVAVPRLPRISNATDFEPLARTPGVRVAYVPLSSDLADADALVLPGTKNTVDDLDALRAAGFDRAIASFDGPVVGICGGYQMLGDRIHGASIEGSSGRDTVPGFGLLPVETTFSSKKRTERVTVEIDGVGPVAGARGTIRGYEIHMGETERTGDVRPFARRGAATDRVLGTYLHGLFENETVRTAFREHVFRAAGKPLPEATAQADATDAFDRVATLLETHAECDLLTLAQSHEIDGQ